MVILIIKLLFVTDSGLSLPGTSFLVMKTLHTLKTSLRTLVLLLKLGDLGAHRMQLLKLILKSLLLHCELVLLLLLGILPTPNFHLLLCCLGIPLYISIFVLGLLRVVQLPFGHRSQTHTPRRQDSRHRAHIEAAEWARRPR